MLKLIVEVKCPPTAKLLNKLCYTYDAAFSEESSKQEESEKQSEDPTERGGGFKKNGWRKCFIRKRNLENLRKFRKSKFIFQNN